MKAGQRLTASISDQH